MDKKVNIGHIITTIALGASLVAWGGNIDKRVENNRITIEHVEEQQQRDRDQAQQRFSEIREDLKDIGDKLDRLLEKPN